MSTDFTALDRIDAMLERCRDRGVRLSHLESARNALADLTGKHAAALAELQQLRTEAEAPRARCHLCRAPLGIVMCTDCTEDLAAEAADPQQPPHDPARYFDDGTCRICGVQAGGNHKFMCENGAYDRERPAAREEGVPDA